RPRRSDPLQLLRVLPVGLRNALVRPVVGVLGHVGRVPARRRRPSERLCDRSDVMRPRTTTDAEVANTELAGPPCEVADLVPVTSERVERGRERPSVREGRV